MDNVFLCRAYQICAAALLRIKPVKEQAVLTGEGSIVETADILKENGIAAAEIITTAGTVKRGMLQPLTERLTELGIRYAIFDGVRSDPDTECIEVAADMFVREGCGAIIAVGGGSAMDCAKIAAARAACPGKSVRKMKGLFKIHRKLPLLIAVPTTAGTGSEITVAAVVTDSEHDYKFTVMDFCLVPKAAVLDPALTRGLPPQITAETGMDAFTHAIEAYTNRFSSKHINDCAVRALRLIDGNIRVAAEDGSDMKARENMLTGAYYAGLAFTNGYVGYVHAIAHAIGGLYHVPHGRACAIVLPVVLESYGDAVFSSLAGIADELGVESGAGCSSGKTDVEKAAALIAHIRELNRQLGIPDKFAELREKDIPLIARRAAAEANPAYPVPRIFTESELADIVRKLMK